MKIRRYCVLTVLSIFLLISHGLSFQTHAQSNIDPAQSQIIVDPTGVPADGVSATLIGVFVRDSSGGAISGVTVSLSANPVNGVAFVPASRTSDGSGFAGNFAIRSTVPGTVTITAVANGVTLASPGTVTFTATPPVSASLSSVIGPNRTLRADGNDTGSITVVVRNINNAPAPGKIVTLNVTPSSGVTITPSSATSDQQGVAGFNIRSTVPGSVTITAVADGITLDAIATANFAAIPISPSLSTIVVNPTSVAANGTSTSTITVTLRDASNNLLTGRTVRINSNAPAGVTISPTSAATDGNGVATFSVRSTVAGTFTFQATIDGIEITNTPTITFTALPPDPVQSVITVSPSSVRADGVSTATVTVTVKNSFGAVLGNQNVTLLADPGSGVTIAPSSALTNASGVATFTIKSNVIATVTLSANANGVQLTSTAVINFTGPSATNSTVVANPTLVLADGNAASTITVTVLDSSNSPLSGIHVSLNANTTNQIFISSLNTATDPAGKVIFTVRSAIPQTVTFTATADGVQIQNTATVTFTAPAPSPSLSTVTVNPSSVLADGVAASTITVTVHDNSNASLVGVSVTLNANPSNGVSITPGVAMTDTSGVAVFTVRSTTAGTVSFTAIAGSTSLDATPMITFVAPLQVSATNSAVLAASKEVAANGSAAATIVVVIHDAADTPLADRTVTLVASTSDGLTFSSTTATTDANGAATFAVRSTVEHKVTFSASAAGITISTTAAVSFKKPSK